MAEPVDLHLPVFTLTWLFYLTSLDSVCEALNDLFYLVVYLFERPTDSSSFLTDIGLRLQSLCNAFFSSNCVV